MTSPHNSQHPLDNDRASDNRVIARGKVGMSLRWVEERFAEAPIPLPSTTASLLN